MAGLAAELEDQNVINEGYLSSAECNALVVSACRASLRKVTRLVRSPAGADDHMVTRFFFHLGSSDHINILCTVKVDTAMPEPPPSQRVYHWKTAPWDRIRGGIRADLRSWKAGDFKTVDGATDDSYGRILTIVDKFVKTSVPRRSRLAPWWEKWWSRSVRKKSAFTSKVVSKEKCKQACSELKDTERAAYKQHRRRLAKRLNETRSDADWWHTVNFMLELLNLDLLQLRVPKSWQIIFLKSYLLTELKMMTSQILKFQIEKTFLLSVLHSRM